MLADRLPRHRQARAQLLKVLSVARVEAVEQQSPARIRQRLEHLVHLCHIPYMQLTGCTSTICSRRAACQRSGLVEFPEPGERQVALVKVEGLHAGDAVGFSDDEYDKRNLDLEAIGGRTPQDRVTDNAGRRM